MPTCPLERAHAVGASRPRVISTIVEWLASRIAAAADIKVEHEHRGHPSDPDHIWPAVV